MHTVSHESAIASGFGLCVALRCNAPSGFQLCRRCSMRLATEAGIRDWLRPLWGPSLHRSLRYSRLLPLLPLGPWKPLVVAQASGGDIGFVVDEFESPLFCLSLLWQRPNACRRSVGTSVSQPCGGYKTCSSGTFLFCLPIMSSAFSHSWRPKGAAFWPPGVGLLAVGMKWASSQLLLSGGAYFAFRAGRLPCTGLPTVSSFWFREDGIAKLTRGEPRVTRPDRPSYYRPTERNRSRLNPTPPSVSFLRQQTLAPAVQQGRNELFVDDVVYSETASSGNQESYGVHQLSTSCQRLSATTSLDRHKSLNDKCHRWLTMLSRMRSCGHG